MIMGLRGLVGCALIFGFVGMLHAEQLTSACRITAVDAAAHTVTLVRKTASGEKTGVAKVTATVKVTVDGQAASLESLTPPTEATVVFDTVASAVVEIRVAKSMATTGPTPTSAPPPLAIAPFDAAKAKEHQAAWAKYLGVPVEMTNSIGMKFVLIPPGEFDMGSTQEEVEQLLVEVKRQNDPSWHIGFLPGEAPKHRVRITRAFCLGATEVTVGQIRQFVADAGYVTEGEKDGTGGCGFDATEQFVQKPEWTWRQPGFKQSDDCPVVQVSWNDTIAFCDWLSRKEGTHYRLPTEAEWEYACRAGSMTKWSFGNEETGLDGYAWYTSNWQGRTHPVGEKKPNALGLYDMHGNAWEWCNDWYDSEYYKKSPVDDPPGAPQASSRLVRGGGWRFGARSCRSAIRHGAGPSDQVDSLGLRLVQVLPGR